jgi:chromosomal replication initiation ATPase DnaA
MTLEQIKIIERACTYLIRHLIETSAKSATSSKAREEEVVEVLIEAIAAHFKIPLHVYISTIREQPTAYKRQLGMAAIKRVTSYPYIIIDEAFGGNGYSGKSRYACRVCSEEETKELVTLCENLIIHLNIKL